MLAVVVLLNQDMKATITQVYKKSTD